LLIGLYDGCFPVSQVCESGNLGLGCSHGLDGEMILDGDCYIARANQHVKKMAPSDKLPFAQVAQFQPDGTLPIASVKSKEALEEKLLSLAQTNNLFIGFRIEGAFKSLSIRVPPMTAKKPYPPMVELLKNQTIYQLNDVQGTLVGFWSPKQYQGTTVAGIHFHFVDSERIQGGHVLEIQIERGKLAYQLYDRLELQLSVDQEFLDADLDYGNLDAHIKHTEGQ
jgi:acetolactate decarboxylase